ncbi:phosphatase PAP2 family protein [Streptomyces sp. NPDC049577]|uniref:phosphatase PAP2 family protein n=1 Tax=Streptomyces sp. NPDC049577 TaxID=3155153 RepID=UPI00342FA025
MGNVNDLHEAEGRLTGRVASCHHPLVRWARPVVGEAAEHTKLWWAIAVTLAATGGSRGRKAAVAGLTAMGVGELLSNGVIKPLSRRRRPPRELIPHDGVDDRPDSSSFPSGHTAAAVAFTTAVALTWPRAGALCAVPAALVAAERVHSGAHYPSDVAAGAALGAAGACTARCLLRLKVAMHRSRWWVPAVTIRSERDPSWDR